MATPHRHGTLARLGRTLTSWEVRFHRRRELARLDERILRDIGLSRAEVMAEATKPFWRS